MNQKEIDEPSNCCTIKDKIKVICPTCGEIITLPMKQAVNGEKIICCACKFEFEFRNPE